MLWHMKASTHSRHSRNATFLVPMTLKEGFVSEEGHHQRDGVWNHLSGSAVDRALKGCISYLLLSNRGSVSGFKATYIYYIIVCVGQKFRHDLVGSSKSLMGLQLKCWSGLGSHLKTQLGKILLSSSCGCWQDSILCRSLDLRPQFPAGSHLHFFVIWVSL